MNYGFNPDEPMIMHVDLNSAFATTEQQAHPSLRGRPMGVTNRKPNKMSTVIAASYEAKALGITVGTSNADALAICPDFVMLETDPAKYHVVYQKLIAIMQDYSPTIKMKSIDEGIIDFRGTLETVHRRPLTEIGYEIKERVRRDIGCWMRINVGIGPNQFLAKQAAGWHKPDGLDVIDKHNYLDYYRQIKLTDLTGIASHFEARLMAYGIKTPLDFLKADPQLLRRGVFKSVIGLDWYQRLRGFEVDGNPTKLGNVGRQFVLDSRRLSEDQLLSRLQFLCETTAKKLRYRAVDARGLLIWVRYAEGDNWYQRKMYKTTFYTNKELYRRALYHFSQRPKGPNLVPSSIGITCYMLTPSTRNQPSIFDQVNKEEWLTRSIDEINEQYGNFAIFSANALDGRRVIKQKIPFGGTDYFDLLLKRP